MTFCGLETLISHMLKTLLYLIFEILNILQILNDNYINQLLYMYVGVCLLSRFFGRVWTPPPPPFKNDATFLKLNSICISLIHILASALHWACFFEKEKYVFDFRHKEFIERELLMPVTNIKDGNLSTELHDCKKKKHLNGLNLVDNQTN